MQHKWFVLGLMLTALTATAEDTDEVSVLNEYGPPIPLVKIDDDKAIDVDGVLDDAIWANIEPISDFLVIEPDTLVEPAYRTELRLAYSDKGIYVAFDSYQPQDSIVERFIPRDARFVARDNVGVTFDTSGDGRYGYWMNLSLGGSEMDGTILPERNYKSDWDGAWYGSTARNDHGWAAEFFMPWSQMAMPKQEGKRYIGIFATRKVAYSDERWGWPGYPNTQPRFISRFPKIEVEGIAPRQQWSVFPFVSGTYDRVTDDKHFQAGADIFWRPSTNFQLTATLNPDFGSVESDNAVINLTANETFFPEKRLFFQEGREIFTLGDDNREGGRQAISLVNTRRIGGRPRSPSLPSGVSLDTRERNQLADLEAAAKMTGQLGRVRYGVMAATEDDTDFFASDSQFYTQSGRDFGVFRVLYEDDTEAAAYRGLGWMSTIVAHPDEDAIVHATDQHYLTRDGLWRIDNKIIFSDLDSVGSGSGIQNQITYSPSQGVKHQLFTSHLDDKIDVNDLGFQLRNNATNMRYQMEWKKSGLKRVRNFRISPFVRLEYNGDGERTNNAIASSGAVTFNNLMEIRGFLGIFPKRYDDRNSFGNGTYTIEQRYFADIGFRTDGSKALVYDAKIGHKGESKYGSTIETEVGMTWRPLQNLSMEFEVEHKDRRGWLLHQENRNFTAFKATEWKPELNLTYFPTAKQQLNVAMQWVGIRAREHRFYELPQNSKDLVQIAKPDLETDDFSISQLNFQVRYRWQIAPLSDLFIVYTKSDRDRNVVRELSDMFRDNWNDPLGDQLVVKLRYRMGS